MELCFDLPSSIDVPRRPAPHADGGWGLQLVDSIVSRWGKREGSTHVWFEIERG